MILSHCLIPPLQLDKKLLGNHRVKQNKNPRRFFRRGVINGISGDTVFYNDPAGARAGETISVEDFMKAWKKRFIVVRP